MRLSAVAGLVVIAATSHTADAQQCAAEADQLTSFGYVSNDGSELQPGIIIGRDYRDGEMRIKYLRLLVEVAAPGGVLWNLTIRDEALRPVETISSTTMGGDKSRWTRRIYTEGVIRLDLDTENPAVKITLPSVIVMPLEAKRPYYSLQGGGAETFKSLYEASTPSESRRAGDHIGLINAIYGKASWCCSAVAVTEDTVLTNWHCGGDPKIVGGDAGVWSQAICRRTLIDFSWDGDDVDREFACKEVLATDKNADIALLRVEPINRSDTLRPIPLRQAGPVIDETLRMIHHPACRPKQVSNNCKVSSVQSPSWKGNLRSDFKYPCDTENGSSGAPLLDAQGRMVGIHHLGFELVDGECDRLNKGVALPSVLDAMKPEVASRIRKANPPR